MCGQSPEQSFSDAFFFCFCIMWSVQGAARRQLSLLAQELRSTCWVRSAQLGLAAALAATTCATGALGPPEAIFVDVVTASACVRIYEAG